MRFWIISINMILCCLSVIFIVLQLCSPDWIEQGTGSRRFDGNLLSKNNVFYTNYSCKKSDAKFCKGLMKLWKAGIIYLSLELCSIICLIVCGFLYLKLLNNLPIKLQLLTWILPLGLFFHLTGFVLWSLIVDLKFGQNNCKVSYHDTETAPICGKSSPILGVIIIFLIFLSLICSAFTIHYLKKSISKFEENIQELKILNKI